MLVRQLISKTVFDLTLSVEINRSKTAALVNKINDLELIVTDNEVEALVLENNLNKRT